MATPTEAIKTKLYPVPQEMEDAVIALAVTDEHLGAIFADTVIGANDQAMISTFVEALVLADVPVPKDMWNAMLRHNGCDPMDPVLANFLATGNTGPNNEYAGYLCGETMRPDQLPGLMLEATRLDWHDEVDPDRQMTDSETNKAMLEKLINDWFNKYNLELDYQKKKPTKKAYHQKCQFNNNSSFDLFCKRCATKNNKSVVIRGSFDKQGQSNCLHITEIWMHDVHCKCQQSKPPPSKTVAEEDGGVGYLLYSVPNPGEPKALLGDTFDAFVDELNKYQNPTGSSKCQGVPKKYYGLPPAEPINFNHPDETWDTRRQIRQTYNDDGSDYSYKGWDPSLKTTKHACFKFQFVYRAVTAHDAVKEFTIYIPDRNPPKLNGNQPYAVGDFPVAQGTGNKVHLYFRREDFFIVIDGFLYKEDRTGLVPTGEPAWIHQMAHRDMVHDQLSGGIAANNALNGLIKPGAFNLPMETTRSIWMREIENQVTAGLGELLFVNGNCVHGGLNFVWNGRHHPSYHVVMSSILHKINHNKVGILVRYDNYLPRQHAALRSPQDFSDEIEHLHERFRQLADDALAAVAAAAAATAVGGAGPGLSPQAQAILALYGPIWAGNAAPPNQGQPAVPAGAVAPQPAVAPPPPDQGAPAVAAGAVPAQGRPVRVRTQPNRLGFN